MKKWEYGYMYVLPLDQQEDVFNKMGKQGWELVCIGPRPLNRKHVDKEDISIEYVDREEWEKIKREYKESDHTEVFWFKRQIG